VKGEPRWFERIACVDFETFYSQEFSLSKMSNVEYIRDQRFHLTAVGIQMDDEPYASVYDEDSAYEALLKIDWSKTALMCHHLQFDGFIMTDYLALTPCFYIDTLSMSRALHGTHQRHDLNTVARLYGREGKVNKSGLVNMKGVHSMWDLPEDQRKTFVAYTGGDVEDTMHIGTKMLEHTPVQALQLIDMTMRMFCEPMIEFNAELAQEIFEKEIKRKQDLLAASGYTDPKIFSSTPRFAALLEELGVEVPQKLSPTAFKKGEMKTIPALAMGDIEFKELREHPDPLVQAVVEARIATKSTLVETRSAAIIRRSKQADTFPVYLKYAGAHTLRWSGGDGVNPQNLPRGSDLRKTLTAPEGYLFNISDSAQIEARFNAWRSGQRDILDAFRRRQDVYSVVAAKSIYNKLVEDITKDERFVGKTCVLGLGYGMGAKKFKHTLKIGQFGPPVDMTLEECTNIVNAWRATNKAIVDSWGYTHALMKGAFLGNQETTDGLLYYERFKTDGYVHLPNGQYLRYHNIGMTDEGELCYETRAGKTKLYGGIEVENIIQCLSCLAIGEQMIRVQEELPTRIVTCTHDEIVCLSKKKVAERVQEELIKIMSVPPKWAEGLPLHAEGLINRIYAKA
jgi:DNA polymerase